MASVLRKSRGAWTGKIPVTEAGGGSLWPGRGAGHRKVSRVTVNKNQQYMLGYTSGVQGREGVLLLGRMFAQAAHMENREGDWQGGSVPEISYFHLNLWGRWAGNALFFLRLYKT